MKDSDALLPFYCGSMCQSCDMSVWSKWGGTKLGVAALPYRTGEPGGGGFNQLGPKRDIIALDDKDSAGNVRGYARSSYCCDRLGL